MGSWPLAQPLFYQYRCTCEQADRLCCNGPAEISAIQDRLGSITIKRSNLITLDLLQSPAAQPREVLDRLPKHPNPAPLAWDSGGTAAAGEKPCLPTPTPAPQRRAAAAGRCTPRRSRGTLKDGRRRTDRCAQRIRPEPCGDCSARSCKGQQGADVTAVGLLESRDVLLAQG